MGKSVLSILSVFAIFYNDFYVICWNRLDDFRFFDGSILVRHDRAFGGETLKKLNKLSAFQCTQACLSAQACISQTFCENGNTNRGACFLHKHGITSEWDDNFIVKHGCIFQQFIDLHEAGCSRKCAHGERCFYDNINRRFSCGCEAPYHGVYCEQYHASSFRFTTLNAQGNAGPTSTAGYENTTLQGQVALIKGLQLWRVPFSAVFSFTLAGGAGGDATTLGGHGVIITGSVHLLKGTLLYILVGQQGTSGSQPMDGAGGGGGTFVLFGNNTPLAAAGGGGGGGGLITSGKGEDGQASTNGSVNGGSYGSGGFVCATEPNDAGGGGGIFGNGSCSDAISCKRRECNQGGFSFWDGGLGGTGVGIGGFGGGGAAHGSFPGGGGGYSGGGVSIDSHGVSKSGGGGSYWISGPSTVVRGQHGADGYVLIQFLG